MSDMKAFDEGINEVRRWKDQVSQRMEMLGSEEFHRQATSETADFMARLEAARNAKLSNAPGKKAA